MKKLSDLTNRIVSSSASLVALVALGTSLYEARLNREQQRATVWPYLTQGNTDLGGHYSRLVANDGMGPALVRSFQVRARAHGAPGDTVQRAWRPAKRWIDVFRALGVDGGQVMTSTMGHGRVLRAGESVTILSLSDSARSAAFHARVNDMETIVCYCSLYGECWSDSSEEDEPRPVDACAEEPALEFER